MVDNRSGIFSIQKKNMIIHMVGPNLNISSPSKNNNLSSTMFQQQTFGRQRYNECNYRRFQTLEHEQGFANSSYANRPLANQPFYSSDINGRCGSPISVRSIDSTVTVPDIITSLSVKSYTFDEVKAMVAAFEEFKKTHYHMLMNNKSHRNKIRKPYKYNKKLHSKRMRRNSSSDSGEQGSNSSISDDDCMSTRTGFSRYRSFKGNKQYRLGSNSRSIRSDMVDLRRTMRDSDILLDNTDKIKQNTLTNIISVQSRMPSTQPNNPVYKHSFVGQKDRFINSSLVPSQRFSNIRTLTTPEEFHKASRNMYMQKREVLHQDPYATSVVNNNNSDTECEEIFSSTVRDKTVDNNMVHQILNRRYNRRERLKSNSLALVHNGLDLDNNNDTSPSNKNGNKLILLPNNNSQKNAPNLIKLHTHILEHKDNQSEDDFIFTKPHLPVRKLTTSKQTLRNTMISKLPDLNEINQMSSDSDNDLHCTNTKAVLSREKTSNTRKNVLVQKQTTRNKNQNSANVNDTNNKHKDCIKEVTSHGEKNYTKEKNILPSPRRKTKLKEPIQEQNKTKSLNYSKKQDKKQNKGNIPKGITQENNFSTKEQIPKEKVNSFNSDEDNLHCTRSIRILGKSKTKDTDNKTPITNKTKLSSKRKGEEMQTKVSKVMKYKEINNLSLIEDGEKRRSIRLLENPFSKCPLTDEKTKTNKEINNLSLIEKEKRRRSIRLLEKSFSNSPPTNEKTKTNDNSNSLNDVSQLRPEKTNNQIKILQPKQATNSRNKTTATITQKKNQRNCLTKTKIEKRIISPKMAKNNRQNEIKENITINKNSNDFNFAKPDQPVNKTTKINAQDKVKDKARTPVISEQNTTNRVKNTKEKIISKSNTPLGNVQGLTISNSKSSAESSSQLVVKEKQKKSCQPEKPESSFLKRKLFTQTLDIIDNKNNSNDSLQSNSPHASMYSTLSKEKHKARKIVINQSCLKRDVLQEEENLLDLIHKIVPPDRMNVTSLNNKTETQTCKTSNDNSKEKWDITSVMSTYDNHNLSDTYTDEDIFNVNKINKKKKKTVSKKKTQSTYNKSPQNLHNNKRKHSANVDISLTKNSKVLIEKNVHIDKIAKENTKILKKNGINKENVHKYIDSFWNTDSD